MIAQSFRHLLTLESPVRQPDGAGGYTESWLPIAELWVTLEPKAARQAEALGATLSRQSFDILLRAIGGSAADHPRPGMRLRGASRVFVIESVAPADGSGLYLRLDAYEEITA